MTAISRRSFFASVLSAIAGAAILPIDWSWPGRSSDCYWYLDTSINVASGVIVVDAYTAIGMEQPVTVWFTLDQTIIDTTNAQTLDEWEADAWQ